MSVMNVESRALHVAPMQRIETPSPFNAIFDVLKAEKIDQIMTKIAYEVDWEGKGKTTVNIITNITKSYVQVVGYMPVVGVSLGAFKFSIGALRLSLLAASMGARKMLGLEHLHGTDQILSLGDHVGQGFIEVLPLAIGAGVYVSSYVPSLEIFVSDLKVKENKLGVVTQFCETTVESAFKEDPEAYPNLKPWARSLAHACEKTYLFATEGAECIVTCAAWGDIALGVGALAVSPFTGAASMPYGIASIARGALALGASSLLDLASQYDLLGRVKEFSYLKKLILLRKPMQICIS